LNNRLQTGVILLRTEFSSISLLPSLIFPSMKW
jgi:hypothetical protein